MPSLPARARVVVIGGGFAGASTAFHLARAGVNGVVIVEREAVCGVHASGRNAALGRQLTEDARVTDLTVRGAAFLRQPPPGFSEQPLWEATGSILWSDDDDLLASLARAGAARGIASERISPAAVVARWPRLAGGPGGAGLYVPGDGVIDVHAALAGYVAGARAGGVRVVCSCEVESLEARGTGAAVVTNRGTCHADVVVNAAGAWVDAVAEGSGASGGPFTPIHRHLFVTEPVQLSSAAPFVWLLGADEFYVRREGAGLLLSACDERPSPPCDARVSGDAREGLAEKMSRVAPEIADLGIARAWACLRTFAPDRRPVVGWDDEVPWLFWVAGLGGHGATASHAIGEDAAAGLRERL